MSNTYPEQNGNIIYTFLLGYNTLNPSNEQHILGAKIRKISQIIN